MKRKWIAALLSLVMAAALIPAAAFAAEPGVSNDTQNKTYTTIQAALDDAAEGDVITLSAGVYKENLTVSTAVTIQGPANGEAVIQFDAATKQAQEYFGGRTAHPTIYATADLTLKNLTVAGPTNVHHGIDGILAKADLTMEGVTVKDIRCTADGGFVCGVQYGLGVMVDGEGDVTIRDCQIVDFQKQAIDLNTTGNIIIESNIITGVGEQAIIAQNGLVIRKGNATIADNEISGMVYSADNEWIHCSIGVYALGDAQLTVTGNTVEGIDNALAVADNAQAQVTGNTLLAPVINYREDGYLLEAGKNYWGESPDMESLLDGSINPYPYYTDKEMSDLTEPLDGVTLDKTEATMEVGVTLQLHASATPEYADDKTLVWSTSDSGVASVDENGLVTAKAVGTAVITVKNAKGDAKTCTITVQAAAVDGGEEAPATGDSSSLVLWVGMLTVSALAGTALLVKKHLGSMR